MDFLKGISMMCGDYFLRRIIRRKNIQANKVVKCKQAINKPN